MRAITCIVLMHVHPSRKMLVTAQAHYIQEMEDGSELVSV